MGFGRRLRDARIASGLSFADIEEETKIRKYYLEALENENFKVLPPPVYASGFVKRYASILGLDEQEVVAEFRELAYGREKEPEMEERLERVPVASRKRLPIKNIAAGIVFLVIALWLGSFIASYIANRGQEKIAQAPQTQTQDTQTTQTETPPPVPSSQSPAQVSGVQVELEALARCWIQVTVDGKQQFSGTLAQGEKKTFAGNKNVTFKSGNRSLKVTVNGKEQPPLQGSGPHEYNAQQ